MPRQVLVIDSNSAVQAIALLALNHANCQVKALTDGSKAIEAIQKLRPHLVLCAKEMAGINALELCKLVQAKSPDTRFILLAPAETTEDVVAEAKKQGYHDVLFKPFKSNRLRDSVLKVLDGESGPELAPGEGIFLQLEDKLTRVMIERVLGRIGLKTVEEKKPASSAALVIADPKIPRDVLSCGRPVLVLCDVHEVTATLQRSPNVKLLSRPLSYAMLLQAIGGYIPLPEQALKQKSRALEAGEAALYAAKTSAAIFSALLSQPCFQQRNWEEAGDIAKEEVIKLGRELDARS